MTERAQQRRSSHFHFPRHGDGISVELYLRDLAGQRELEKGELQALFARMRDGDMTAREELVLAHLRLVVRIACLYIGYGLPLADLISEGNLGLLRAVELYDPGRGVAFETYASVWIRQRIHRAITAQAKTVRIPVWRSQRLRKVDRLQAELNAELGRDATVRELAERLGMDEEELTFLESDRTRVESLDAVDGMAGLLKEELELPHERLSREELQEEIYACLADLDDHELQVLSLKFGLFDEEPVSYREMAPRLGRNREWIRRVGERALAKARASLQTMGSIPRRVVKGMRLRTEQRLGQLQGEGGSAKNSKKSPQALSVQPSVLIPWLDNWITNL